ncbi:MAG TPA: LuxR C-terminal-related transcriptional regulator, partial [Chitinophaga sp.]|nr:LuxR C-terminal-related transcriptional regulator [Chitinophaga sp.]
NAQKIDARYRAAQQEQKIALLEQEAAFREKRNLLYIGLGITGVVALSFLLVSYNYRLKSSMRKQELIDKEKEEVILKVKLQEAETNQLLAEQLLLRERQERLQKELLAEQLQKEEKNQLMKILADKDTTGNEQVKRLIRRQQQLDEEYEDHKTDFVEVHSAFFEQLQQHAGDTLTRLDMKYCSYILMGLSNKEISTRLSIEPKSIRMARYRLKQKLGLGKDDSLDNFIKTLG